MCDQNNVVILIFLTVFVAENERNSVDMVLYCMLLYHTPHTYKSQAFLLSKYTALLSRLSKVSQRAFATMMKSTRFVIPAILHVLSRIRVVTAFLSVPHDSKTTPIQRSSPERWWCPSSSRGRGSSSSTLCAHSLTSALESLGQERRLLLEEDWISNVTTTLGQGSSSLERDDDDPLMPLYPLPAVYVPSGDAITYTLQNIEPRNIQMALDLMDDKYDRRFCAVLRAVDTGRMARVGTVMRILDVEVQARDGDIQKIVLTCVAQTIVDIVRVENPEAADLAYRLKHPKEYLRATVRSRQTETPDRKDENDDVRVLGLASQISEDFNRVREYLIEGVGIDDLPPFARTNVADALPPLEASQLVSPSGVWHVAYRWQTYAYTLREGYQQNLAGDRNELLIAGALKQGGPLNLPVHVTDLSPEDRRQVVQLERERQEAWIDTGLEPVVDFQALLVASNHVERLEQMATMVARERERLTRMALLPRAPREGTNAEENIVRKGAWFDDDW